jgi:hypothetical protein
MSIKRLFGNSEETSSKYLSEKSEGQAFEDVESSRNLKAVKQTQSRYVPQIDYTNPQNFAKFGSAYLYYHSSIQRILDFYPYDGSFAEKNEFHNKALDIEKYVFDNLYPRTNGYALLSADGWGSADGSKSYGYGLPASQEYIELRGGPTTGSGDTLVALSPDPDSSKFQYSNVYDENMYQNAGLPSNYGSGSRQSNLKSDFDSGVTVEFWLKKPAFETNKTEKEVIFDLWNNNAANAHNYGRMTVFLSGTVGSSATPLYVTVQSGTTNIYDQAIGSNVTLTTIQDWNHYAITLQNSGSDFDINLFLNGQIDARHKVSSKSFNELDQIDMMGRIGSLITTAHPNPASPTTAAGGNRPGGGKLSGSIDEFRFWKVARSAREIGINWFDQVGGGVNTDISNTELGIYYKFNEGITGDSAVDNTVLDYGGRICNGVWVGYDASSRNTGSAMVESGHAKSEYLDPIIYSTHPEVSTLKTNLLNSGSWHDRQNNSNILGMLPSWIVEEDENKSESDPYFSNLRKMTHIVGAYFDKIHLQISELIKIKNPNYVSGTNTPVPFAEHLPQSLGLYSPDIFVDSELIEKFLNKTISGSFEGDLEETKNLIYTNLYNNVAHIYKAKGTEKSIKNALRCFYLNDDLMTLKINARNTEFVLSDKLVQRLVRKKYINYNDSTNTSAVVYQAVSGALHVGTPTSDSRTDVRGYISGSGGEGITETRDATHPDNAGHGYGYEDRYGFTAEADILFPAFYRPDMGVSRSNITSSLFGMYTAVTASQDNLSGSETFWIENYTSAPGPDYANFQVYAVKDETDSKNVYFKLSSSNHPFTFPDLNSSVFPDVYDNSKWNISVSLRPVQSGSYDKNFGFTSGSAYGELIDYEVIFRGYNIHLNQILNQFVMTSILTASADAFALNMLRSPKRMYAGSERVNITGAVKNPSDTKLLGVRYWGKSLTNEELQFHAKDFNNIGISGSYRRPHSLDKNNLQSDVRNLNYLFLNWNFNNVTASNNRGQFYVDDYSSGSVSGSSTKYGWTGRVGGYQHTGYGYGFTESSTDVVKKENLNTFEFIDPEQVVSSDLIQILSEDDKVFGIVEEAPSFHYTIEKSLYDAVSRQMLDFFAGANDFHNVIGHPVHRYRHRYKDLEKLREIFFRRVTAVTDVEKFIDYYKWFDKSITTIISQLVPATAKFSDDVLNVVESHVLERNKYQSQFPTIEFVDLDLDTAMGGAYESSYPWPKGHSPVPSSPRSTSINSFFWKTRARIASEELASSNSTLDAQRQRLKDIIHKGPTLTASAPALRTTDGLVYQNTTFAHRNFAQNYRLQTPQPLRTSSMTSIKGGTNFDETKRIDFTYNALRPAGPVARPDGACIPENVLVGFTSDVVGLGESHADDLTNINQKTKRFVKVNRGRHWTPGGYTNVKSSLAFPFNIMSSSVKSGYNRMVAEEIGDWYEIVNLHNDSYGELMEVPMQGPFTNYAVGGHQSRHIDLNSNATDTYLLRPEAWKLLLGTCLESTPYKSGAIGMVPPDYPWPEANEKDVYPYPMTASHKAVYYRDFIAKRPVNIRNIALTTGSTANPRTVLGNYQKKYQVLNTFGAYNNPRAFIENQPILPTEISSVGTQVRTLLDVRRTDDSHRSSVSEYSIGYLITSSAGNNKTVITNRFSAQGGIEVDGLGYKDFRGAEYSVYNAVPYRNLMVIKPSQGPTGTTSEATGSGTTGIRVSDICIDPVTKIGKDFGLRAHLARHSGRFGRDSLFVSGTTSTIDGPATTAGGPGASLDQFPSLHKVQRNTLSRLKITNDGDYANVKTVAVASSYVHDNFFVNRAIPRSDRQYNWISNSVQFSTDPRYNGHAKTYGEDQGLFSSSTDGYVAFFDGLWITSSVIVPEISSSMYQPVMRLNTLTLDSLTGSGESNVLGFASNASNTSYINNDLLNKMQMSGFISSSTDYFNLLMTRRKNTYGWSWTKMHQSDHPILVNERKNNKLSLTTNNRTVTSYDLPVVSLRGRPGKINASDSRRNSTLKVSSNNQEIFFSDTELNNLQIPGLAAVETAFNKVLKTARGSSRLSLNWVLYSENLFPPLRRELVSSSYARTGYDNQFWRTTNADRVTLGNTLKNSFNLDRSISQSAWVLDAQEDFLTRTRAALARTTNLDALISSGAAGELQNNYVLFHSGVSLANANAVKNLVPGALYARKHGLSSPFSVAAPTGPRIAETGSIQTYRVDPFNPNVQDSDVFGGEAKWQAGDLAGYLEKSGDSIVFVSSSSEPWYNEYADYNDDLKKICRGYAVVPEFRISEHVEDYLKLGLNNKSKTDTFEIPGTSLNSSDAQFYKDYSNSEFMANFASVKDRSGLSSAEIRLVCSASIKFNPYKGFYPAQRTVDLVSQFSRSYGPSLIAASTIGANVFPYQGAQLLEAYGGLLRPLMQCLYSPGILFNSIKSGIAVDYPIITDPTKISASFYGQDKQGNTAGDWMISAVSGALSKDQKGVLGFRGGEFFDLRLPFETILKPDKYLSKVAPVDMEPHPSASIYATASLGNPSNEGYSMMMSNFLGEVGNFFLKDNSYTQLKSDIVPDDLRFRTGSVYGMRVKLRRSTTGPRTYTDESGSIGNNTGYGLLGGKLYSGSAFQKAEFPLPQDPRLNHDFKETFTMYSRPSAFGPPLSGRPAEGKSNDTHTLKTAPMDSISGFNWAYTPPYTNGEAWCDMIFRPDGSKSYDLEQILSETDLIYWRADPGYTTGTVGPALIPSLPTNVDTNAECHPYAGYNVNSNAMQISASLSLLGVERVLTQRKDKFGNLDLTENKTSGKRWVIQPRFETPMMNFNDDTVRPITNAEGTLALPVFASASVPRGMWHQFGLLPASSEEGVFVEIGDIPVETLKYHYDIVNQDSVYNNNDWEDTGLTLYKTMKSLSDLVGFDYQNSSKRLGQMKDSLTVKEAIIAVPYITETVEANQDDNLKRCKFASQRKKFISIPKKRFNAALKDKVGTAEGDSLDSAGESIRKLTQKMERYVLPPQFDFINNKNIDPMVMYMFEFEYTFDKDDLSYIWQNLAPRDYKKITKQAQSVAHALGPTELLSDYNICNRDNLRWMIFKVKQKSQTHYTDLVTSQVGQAAKDLFTFDDKQNGYNIAYNWPYDYLSFVETVKFDAEVLYKEPALQLAQGERTPTSIDAEVLSAAGVDAEILSAQPGRTMTTSKSKTNKSKSRTKQKSSRTSRTKQTSSKKKSSPNMKGGSNKGGSKY